MKGTEWLEMRNCGNCGKLFSVLYPHLWRYKRRPRGANVYFCSYSCMRKFDRRGVDTMAWEQKVPEEIKKKAVEEAISGGDPFEVLKPYTGNQKAMWSSIKIQLKKTDPEKWAKIPDLRNKKKAEDPIEIISVAPMPEPIVNIDLPLADDDFEYMVIRSKASKMICERDPDGEIIRMHLDDTHIKMTGEQWKAFLDEAPRALRLLGVEI